MNGSQDLSAFSMLDLFRTEVQTHTLALNEGLLALEADPESGQEIEPLMRAAHSIKGAARIVQVDAVVQVAHALEDCFVAAQEGRLRLGPDHIDLLLHGVDAIAGIGQVTEAEMPLWLIENTGRMEGLVTDLSEILSGRPQVPAQHETRELPPPSSPAPPEIQEQATSAESLAASPTPDAAVGKQEPAQPPHHAMEGKERFLRVSPESLNRLMGLAGESLVETRWLQPFAGSLLSLKKSHTELSSVLERLQESLAALRPGERVSGYLTEARHTVSEIRQDVTDRLNELETFSRRSENLSNRLYREAISSRMRPFADGVEGFPRLVRDLARDLKKRVKFDILGKTTKVDRDILDKLEAPINHLLRNSVDHGIEYPEDRVAAGKPPEGAVRLEARHIAGMLSITVSDDGRGIERESLRAKVLSRNLAKPEIAEQMTEAELMEFLFLPGFSTADQVTEISGRGVGLDVVRSMVAEVGGVVHAASDPGRGMSFHLQLPLTLSVLRAVIVETAGEPYAFPVARIDRVLKVPVGEIEVTEGRQYFRYEGNNVGLVKASQVLELPDTDSIVEELAVVVISDRLDRYGMVVDRFLGERDLVVHPLDPRLGKIADLSSAALMEDGSPVLIVDVEDLVRSTDKLLSGGRLHRIDGSANHRAEKTRKRVLVVDDSITVREVERKLLEHGGFEVQVAVDGMDGWNAVRLGDFDVVVTDVDMPRMDGIELVTRIKEDRSLKEIPVMIVSYKDREEDRLRGLRAGADYYLTKGSFDEAALLQAVVDLVGEAET